MRYDVALPAPGVPDKAQAAERGEPRSRPATPHGASGAGNPSGSAAKPRQSCVIVRSRGMTTRRSRCLVLPRLGRRCAALSYDDTPYIYMTLAVLFIAQATNVDLTIAEQLTILLVAMLTSKGASGVTGAGFITLAATLAVVPQLSVAGMVLILGVDRFMSECRALTNFVGNGVATIVVAAWEKALDRDQLGRAMRGEITTDADPENTPKTNPQAES